jgi:hypothetical protein
MYARQRRGEDVFIIKIDTNRPGHFFFCLHVIHVGCILFVAYQVAYQTVVVVIWMLIDGSKLKIERTVVSAVQCLSLQQAPDAVMLRPTDGDPAATVSSVELGL